MSLKFTDLFEITKFNDSQKDVKIFEDTILFTNGKQGERVNTK